MVLRSIHAGKRPLKQGDDDDVVCGSHVCAELNEHLSDVYVNDCEGDYTDEVTGVTPLRDVAKTRVCAPCKTVRSTQCRVLNAGPHAQCRAVCSMQGRTLSAGPYAQCRVARSLRSRTFLQGRTGNAGPHAQRRATGPHAQSVAVCSIARQSAQLKGRTLKRNAGP